MNTNQFEFVDDIANELDIDAEHVAGEYHENTD